MTSLFKKGLASFLISCFFLSLSLPQAALALPAPDLTAHVAYAVDAKTGNVFYEQNIDSPRSVASLTKLMTSLLVFEGIAEGNFTWTTKVPISPEMQKYAYHDYSGHDFDFPDEETVFELTRLLLVGSSNCAASILAEYIGGTEEEFVQRMNDRARDFGWNASFNDASGLKANAVTARAMVDLSRHLISTYPQFLEFTRQSGGAYRGKSFQSANRLYRDHYYQGAEGLKTGWTPTAGFSFISAASRDGNRVIAIVMGSSSYDNEFIDNIKLLDYAFARLKGGSPQAPLPPQSEDIAGKAFVSLYNKVNYRTGPGTNFTALGQVQEGTPLIGILEKNGWYQLDYQGQEVWIRKDLVGPPPPTQEPPQDTPQPEPEEEKAPTPAPPPETPEIPGSSETTPSQGLILQGESHPTSSWALEDMKEASRLGYDFTLLAGRTAFNGSENLTRAEFAALLVHCYYPQEVATSPHPFLDVPPDTWYHGFIQTAYDKGLVAGVSADRFAPQDMITREQAATMIARAEGLAQDRAFGFQDEDKVSPYALASVRGLAHAGIMVGDPSGTFRPQDPITRQEGTALVLRLHHLHK